MKLNFWQVIGLILVIAAGVALAVREMSSPKPAAPTPATPSVMTTAPTH